MDLLTSHIVIFKVPHALSMQVSNKKLKLLYRRVELSLVVFHVSLLLYPFFTRDLSPLLWWVVIRCVIIFECLSHIQEVLVHPRQNVHLPMELICSFI